MKNQFGTYFSDCFHHSRGKVINWVRNVVNTEKITFSVKIRAGGLPWGLKKVVRNARVGDVGLIPDPRGSHMPQSSKACVPQLLSLWICAPEPWSHNCWSLCTLEPVLGNRISHHNQKPVHLNQRAAAAFRN